MQKSKIIGSKKNSLTIFIYILILIAAIWVRFDNITEQGMQRGDHKKYLKEAKLWSEDEGTYMGGKFYRPVVYTIQSWGVSIFGYNDYGVKIISAIIDTINLILIAALCWLITKNQFIALFSTIFYAFNPRVLYLARSEMVHVQSEFFVLLALIAFILFLKSEQNDLKRASLLMFSGIISYYAINTHAELIFLSFFYYVVLAVTFLKKSRDFKTWIKYSIIFSISHVIPFMYELLILGPSEVLRIIINDISFYMSPTFQGRFAADNKILMPFKILFFSLYYYYRNTFIIFSGLVSFGYILNVVRYRNGKLKDTEVVIVFLLIAAYLLLFTVAFSVFPRDAGRLILPVLPLILIMVFYSLYELISFAASRYKVPEYKNITFSISCILLFIVTVKVIPGKTDFTSQIKRVANKIELKVDENNKLLIAPHIAYSRDRLFQEEMYFNSNALYLALSDYGSVYSPDSVIEFIADNKIKYIYVSRELDDRMLNLSYPYTPLLMKNFQLNNGRKYILKDDLNILNQIINTLNGKLLDEHNYGYLFELNPDSNRANIINYDNYFKNFQKSEKYYQQKDSRIVKKLKAIVGNKY